MGKTLAPVLAALVLVLCTPGARAQAVVAGTQYTLFWRGDLRVIATRPDTRITLIDASTGAPLAAAYTANVAGNPFDLADAGDSFEANCGAATLRVRIVASTARGPQEDKPVIAWTGSLEAGLKHPAAPPFGSNAWLSVLPALAPGSVENGSEIGREFWGFTSKEMWIFARRGPVATSIQIDDVITNVETDSDDTQVVTPASPALRFQDAAMEVYYLSQFEDDTVHVVANTEVSIWVGIESMSGNDWIVTPPSWGAGEDGRELGTLFYAFVSRDLTIFPTVDRTNVTITDLSDGDDSATFTLREGNLAGDYDLFLTDTFARNGTGVTPRASGPAVSLNLLGATAPFENDLVRIEADRPVLVHVGPKAADTEEYADVAYTVQTGPSDFLLYCFAQNGGAQDMQLFAYSPATQVTITSLTATTGFGAGMLHDFAIPAPTPYLGGNAITDDWYWASTIWNGELLRVQARGGPISVISGDYDGPNYGCFIPFVASSGVLLPIADAGPDLSSCPGLAGVTLDGTASFDADTTPGPGAPSWTWDTDPAVDASGDGNFTNDPDLVGPTPTFNLPGAGPFTVTLTFTDDDGQRDTDVLIVVRGDAQPPVVDCPVALSADAGPGGTAFLNVVATATDNCAGAVTIANDFNGGGADASGDYPCGVTDVLFTATDAAGNVATCRSRVTVRDLVPPQLDCPPSVSGSADATGLARVALLATASDACGAPAVTNDRTGGGLDATDDYPCGTTRVTFTATDVGGNVVTCATDVIVADGAAPAIDCPALVTVPPTSFAGSAVAVTATVSDPCDADVPVTNDRTAGGLDASGDYPCGTTSVTFTGTDDAGNTGTCTTQVDVSSTLPTQGISPALRVRKATGQDPFSTAHLLWPIAAPPHPWEHYEVRRTTTPETRPYPVVQSDPAFVQQEWIDPAAIGPLLFYQVHVIGCPGYVLPDPLAPSP